MNVFSNHRSADDLHVIAAMQSRRVSARPPAPSPSQGRELQLAQEARRRREGR